MYIYSQNTRPLFCARSHDPDTPDDSLFGQAPVVPLATNGDHNDNLDDDELDAQLPTFLSGPPDSILNIDTVETGPGEYDESVLLTAPPDACFGLFGNAVEYSRAHYYYGIHDVRGTPCIKQLNMGFQNSSAGGAYA